MNQDYDKTTFYATKLRLSKDKQLEGRPRTCISQIPLPAKGIKID